MTRLSGQNDSGTGSNSDLQQNQAAAQLAAQHFKSLQHTLTAARALVIKAQLILLQVTCQATVQPLYSQLSQSRARVVPRSLRPLALPYSGDDKFQCGILWNPVFATLKRGDLKLTFAST